MDVFWLTDELGLDAAMLDDVEGFCAEELDDNWLEEEVEEAF